MVAGTSTVGSGSRGSASSSIEAFSTARSRWTATQSIMSSKAKQRQVQVRNASVGALTVHADALSDPSLLPLESVFSHPMHVGRQPRQAGRNVPLEADIRKLTTHERAQVDITKPTEVVGWCNKWSVTPERLRATVAEVGTSASAVAKALGKPS